MSADWVLVCPYCDKSWPVRHGQQLDLIIGNHRCPKEPA